LLWVPNRRFFNWLMPKLGFLRVRRPSKAAERFMRAMGCPMAVDPSVQLTEVTDPRKTPAETPKSKYLEKQKQ